MEKQMRAEEKLEKMGLWELGDGVVFGGYIWAYSHDEEDNFMKISEEDYIQGILPDETPDVTMTAEEVLADVVKLIKEQQAKAIEECSENPSEELLERIEYLGGLLNIAEK